MAYPFVPNIAAGRHVELAKRVVDGDPSTARLRIIALKASGLPVEADLRDCATLQAMITAGATEADNVGYARKAVTGAEIAISTDNSGNRQSYDITTNPRWTAPATTGGAWGALVVCYDPNSSADTALIPIYVNTISFTPNDVNDYQHEWHTDGVGRSTPS